MTSCDEDQWTGMQLEGSWEGKMWNSNGSQTITKLMFQSDPFRTTKGEGYWIDIYSHLNYYNDRITWEVKDGFIYIHSWREKFTYTIRDYKIRSDRFIGYISDGNQESYFEMYKIEDAWINDYNWNTGYYSKENKEATEE